MTISDIKQRIVSGETVRSVVESALAKIDDTKDYNAVISKVEARALQRADELDTKLKAGKDIGRLGGVPFIAKDNFLTLTGKTTAASNILKSFEAPYQATAIEKLEAEGAIVIAKSNLDAFAHGSSTENSDFGPTRNPHDKTRVPGGSSGGSAASVALNIVPFALGTDTGGSVRLPASYCGVVGTKGTYGAISRHGVVAMASSTDVVGVMANSVDDAALAVDIMVGKDPYDATTLPDRAPSYLPAPKVKPLKIGLVKEYMTDAVQTEVRQTVLQQVELLKKLGHQVEEVSLPSVDLALAVYYIVVPAEVSSNLSRYDGIKFGHSAEEAKDLQELYGLTRDQGFNSENKRRILVGTYVLSSGFVDAYYNKAQTVRTKLINEFAEAFGKYDVLIGPVAPSTAFRLGEKTADPLRMYLADVMTVAVSLTGLPALSLPAGKDKQDMPIGLHIIGAQRSDLLLFSLAKQLEEANRG